MNPGCIGTLLSTLVSAQSCYRPFFVAEVTNRATETRLGVLDVFKKVRGHALLSSGIQITLMDLISDWLNSGSEDDQVSSRVMSTWRIG